MKKLKKVLLPLLAALCVFALIFAVACNAGGGDGGDGEKPIVEKAVLTKIDLSGGTTSFNINDSWSKGNLVVTATYVKESSKGLQAETTTENVTDKAVIDSSAYDSSNIGVYPIYVSYTYEGVTRYANYNVSVNSTLSGHHQIEIVKETTSYDYSADAKDLFDDLKVYEVDENGIQYSTVPDHETEITNKDVTSACTFRYFKGAEEVTKPNGTKGGTYQVWAFNDYTVGGETFTRSDFVIIYVVDNLASLTKPTDTTGIIDTVACGSSTDDMVASWKFTVTYTSGATKNVTSSDPGIKIGTVSSIGNGDTTVTVTYSELIGGEWKSVEYTMHYTITPNTTTLTYKYSLDMKDAPSSFDLDNPLMGQNIEGNIKISTAEKTGSNKHFASTAAEATTFSDGFEATKYINGNSGDAYVKIEVPGASQIKVWFYCSSGSNGTFNETCLALNKDNAGALGDSVGTSQKRARRDNYTSDPKLAKGELSPVRFVVEEAGTYLLHRGDSNSYRIAKIEISTVIPAQGSGATTLTFPTITYHEQEGVTVSQKLINYDFDGVNKADNYTPERDGYDFLGWFTEEQSGTTVDFTQGITADTDVYAHWQEKEVTAITATRTTADNPPYILVNNSVTIETSDINVTSSTGSVLSSAWGQPTFTLYNNADCEESHKVTGMDVTSAGTYYLVASVTKGETTLKASPIEITVRQPVADDITLDPETIIGRLSSNDGNGEFNIGEAISDVKFKVGTVELDATEPSHIWTITYAVTTDSGTFKPSSDNKIATAVGTYTVTYTLQKGGSVSINKTLTVTVNEYSDQIDPVHLDMHDKFPTNITGVSGDAAILYSGDHATISIEPGTFKIKNGQKDAAVSYDTNNSTKAVNGVEDTSMNTRLKLSGGIAVGLASNGETKTVIYGIKIHVDRACTITAYVRGGNSTSDKTVDLYTFSSDSLAKYTNNSANVKSNTVADEIFKITLTVSAQGDYYLGADNSIGVYGIDIAFN